MGPVITGMGWLANGLMLLAILALFGAFATAFTNWPGFPALVVFLASLGVAAVSGGLAMVLDRAAKHLKAQHRDGSAT